MRNITSFKHSLTTSLVIAVAGLGIAAIPAQAGERTLKVINSNGR